MPVLPQPIHRLLGYSTKFIPAILIGNCLLSHGSELVALLRILGDSVGNQLVGITDSWIAATAAAGVRDHCPSVPCGNLTISSPFGLFPVQASQNHCLRFGFAFQVFCSSSNIPYLRYYDGGEGWSFQILDIFYENSSLIVTDVDELQDFSSCHIPTNNISKHMDPFSISAVNQNLIFYNCTKAPATIDPGLVQTRCGSNTFVRVGGPYDGYNESGSY